MNTGLKAVIVLAAIAASVAIHLKAKTLEAPPPAQSPLLNFEGPDEMPSPLVGLPAPPVAVRTLLGEPQTIAFGAGETVVLNFFATWCGPCRAEMPDLDRFAANGAGRGIRVVAIDVGESAADVAAFEAELDLRLPLYLDENGSVAASYLVDGYPTTVLVGADGLVRQVQVGMIADFEAWYREAAAEPATPAMNAPPPIPTSGAATP